MVPKNLDWLKDVACELQCNGISVMSQVLNADILRVIREHMDLYFDENIHLGSSVNVAVLKDKHLRVYGDSYYEIQKDYSKFYLTDDDFEKGVDCYSAITNGRSVCQPLRFLPELWKIVFDPLLRDVASLYFNEKSKLGFVKVRRFFVNDLPMFDTNYFHIDNNATNLLKAIICLHDVSENDGHFAYIKGSHKDRMPRTNFELAEYYRDHGDLESYYGFDKMFSVTGKVGDIAFADTLGFHRGTKPVTRDRYVLYINFVTEEEYGGKGMKLEIPKEYYDQLDNSALEFGEYLKVV
jgi:hypothetical protein